MVVLGKKTQAKQKQFTESKTTSGTHRFFIITPSKLPDDIAAMSYNDLEKSILSIMPEALERAALKNAVYETVIQKNELIYIPAGAIVAEQQVFVGRNHSTD